jgi:hypothetical protein
VKNGGRLILDGATLESDCEGAQWKGIFVEKAGKERGQVVYVREPILQHIQPNSSLTELNNIEVILPR